MMVLGVDPGMTGGLALLDMSGRLIDGLRMPVLDIRKRRVVDVQAVHGFLAKHRPECFVEHAVLEQVGSMPGQGVASTFTFGRAAGAAEAMALLYADTVEWVTPAVWKKALGLNGSKKGSIDLARTTFGSAYRWKADADNGIAEAALMARWWLDRRS